MEQDVRDDTARDPNCDGPRQPSAQGDGHPGDAPAPSPADPGDETAEQAKPADTLGNG